MSVYLRVTSVFPSTTIGTYIGWYTDASGSGAQFDQVTLPVDNNTVVRLVRTGVAPAGKTHADMIFDSWGGSQTHLDFTAMLVEQVAAVDGYADGDSPLWVWDGTPGLSTSRETGGATRGAMSPVTRGAAIAAVARRTAPAITVPKRVGPTMQRGTS